jgi:hypothetical protein
MSFIVGISAPKITSICPAGCRVFRFKEPNCVHFGTEGPAPAY